MRRPAAQAALACALVQCPRCKAWVLPPAPLPGSWGRHTRPPTAIRRFGELPPRLQRPRGCGRPNVAYSAHQSNLPTVVSDELPDAVARTESVGIWDEEDDDEEDDDQPFFGADEEEYVDIPYGEMLTDVVLNPEQREDGWAGDSTLAAVADEYGFPIEFLMDVMCRWGVPPPVKPTDRLGDLVNGEQAFAIVEAMTSMDSADVRDTYVDESLGELAASLEASLADVFNVCAKYRFNLPLGVETHITVPERRVLLRELGIEDPAAAADAVRADGPEAAAAATAALAAGKVPDRGAVGSGGERGPWATPGLPERPNVDDLYMGGLFSGDLAELFSDDAEWL